MSTQRFKLKCTVTAFAVTVMFSLPAVAQQGSPKAAELLDELQQVAPEQADRVVKQLIDEWSKSGSASMDLLLKRGRDALEVNQPQKAIGHFQALTDHAPDFAEGWHALALAYFQADMYGPSLDALERALALNPQHFGAMRGLGAILEQTGQRKAAYQAFSRALALHPNDTQLQEAVKRLEAEAVGIQI